MTTTPTMAPRPVTEHGHRNFYLVAAALAIAVLATLAFLLTSTSSANDPVSETVRTSTISEPATSRGADSGGEIVRGGVQE